MSRRQIIIIMLGFRVYPNMQEADRRDIIQAPLGASVHVLAG
jgi:hypothetical protein